MNVAELIALLEDVDPEAEVLLGHQPSWPLQFTVAGIAEWDGGTDGEDDEYVPAAYEQERREVGLDDSPPRIYIVEGSHPDDTPYSQGDLGHCPLGVALYHRRPVPGLGAGRSASYG